MPPEERDPACLWDMLTAARAVIAHTKELSFEQFMGEEMIRRATEREFEIIGEAGRRMSATFRAAHPEVPWRKIIGLRNIITHDYEKVDYQRIYDIAKQELPQFIETLEPLVPPPPESGP